MEDWRGVVAERPKEVMKTAGRRKNAMDAVRVGGA